MKIGIVIADGMEYEPLLKEALCLNGRESIQRNHRCVDFTCNNHEIRAVECGIGKVNAAAAAAFLITDFGAQTILNAGLSGAVSGLCKGDFVAGESFVECDFDLSPIGFSLGVKPQKVWCYPADRELLSIVSSLPGIRTGKFGCGDLFLTDAQKKKLYKDIFGICEFDMETAAIASVCHDCEIPFMSVRKISDDADDVAGDSYREMNGQCSSDLTHILLSVIEKTA